MLIPPRYFPSPCLQRRGMSTIFLHLGKFQPTKWGIFNRRKLGNIQPALTSATYSGCVGNVRMMLPLRYTSPCVYEISPGFAEISDCAVADIANEARRIAEARVERIPRFSISSSLN